MAEVLHFYSLSWEELLAMPVAWFCKLWGRIPVVEARRQLAWLPALAYPHLTDTGHRDVHRALSQQARLTGLTSTADRQAPPLPDPSRVEFSWTKLRAMGLPAGATRGEP